MAEGGADQEQKVTDNFLCDSADDNRVSAGSFTGATGTAIVTDARASRELKLSLSSYQSQRSLSSSGETNPGFDSGEIILSINGNASDKIEISNVQESNSTHSNQSGDSVQRTSTPKRSETGVARRPLSVGFDLSVGRKQSVDPGDIRAPIEGFELCEQRSRFTVFKIHVHMKDEDSWYVFRRYSDFVQLRDQLRRLFPVYSLSLPPKRWFRDNFDRQFLDDRLMGLQTFTNNILGNKDVCNSKPVMDFFCFGDPPGPHDSLEESRALTEALEEAVYSLKKDLLQRDTEIDLLREELDLYKSQVQMLTTALREKNSTNGETSVKTASVLPSPANSLAECDLLTQNDTEQSQDTLENSSKRSSGQWKSDMKDFNAECSALEAEELT